MNGSAYSVVDTASKRFQTLASAVSNRVEVNRRVAIGMHSIVMRTFQADGATGGRQRWAPLKAGGRFVGKGKRRRFTTSYQLLRDTGALRNSFMPISSNDEAGVGALSIRRHADIAPVHEYGAPSKNIPARPMLPTRKDALDLALSIYGSFIKKAAE